MKIDMKKYIMLLAVAVLGLTACDDVLEKTPQSKMSLESYFTSETELQLFTNSLYNNLLPKEGVYNEQSDQVIKNNPSDFIKGGDNRIVPNSGGGWSWTDLRKLNTCLEWSAKNCKDEAAYKKYAGVARFFRAYIYYTKVVRFGDVPWLDHEPGTDDPILQAPRDSRELVMTHMIEDIDYAIENLPVSYPNGHHYRVTKWAALALKARFCLFEGTFRKYHDLVLDGHDYNYYLDLAAKAAKEIMDEGSLKLYSTGDPNLDYAVLFSRYDEYPQEYLLSVNFDLGTELFHNGTAISLMNSQGRYSLTKKFVDMYLMKDGSRFTDKAGWETMPFVEEVKDRDPRLAQTVRLPGYSRITENAGKYSYSGVKEGVDMNITLTGFQFGKWVMPENNASDDKFDRSYNDLPIFRLAEVYLIYAEAKAELGTLDQNDLDISVNKLRDRVGMPHMNMAQANANPDPYLSSADYGYPNVTGTNKGVILEIRRERAVELCMEGFRIEDIDRWKAGYCLNATDSKPKYYRGIYISGKGPVDIDGDGTMDVNFYGAEDPVPAKTSATYLFKIGTDVYLSEGNKGYLEPFQYLDPQPLFDENRDYFFPIPIDERSLNNNLSQNPGWNDGLSF